MSLDKSIKSGKEKRDPYRKSSSACWNHGGCSFCLSNRVHRYNKYMRKAVESFREYAKDPL